VEEDYLHPKMFHSTGYNMELDVYIEDLKLACEYQGQQHYRPIYGMGSDFEQQQKRDEEKRIACKKVAKPKMAQHTYLVAQHHPHCCPFLVEQKDRKPCSEHPQSKNGSSTCTFVC